ncbi:uncharacterized protein [Elaeis guineensis]|uniref:Protein phosphatase 1 regulatory subunit 7 isoform X1 n=1 Tax=Elaeis guineensis var. tenera TaxID=51953 RepID=A0A6I9QNC2_ELAGV|nr:protein phosphatase 1 regulatory subunit 7 isoform X1 [Elaeis guineensis]
MSRLTLEQISRENKNSEVVSTTSLQLSHRALSNVSCLSKFQNLERLDLNCNCLSTLEDLSSCINLKWLSVVENKLESLKGVEGLTKLTVLNAGKNKLRTMNEIRSVTSLRALILNDNNISSICKLDQLQYLNTLVLSRNPIHNIGDSLLKLKSITKLSLSHCQIENIGSSLMSCVDLKEIRFAHNKIMTLPAELAQNIKVQNFDLGNNLIENWSDLKVLSALHNLKNLNLQGNPIVEKDKLAKKVKKLLPNLRIFNAKPIEKSGRSEKISGEDGLACSKDNLPLHNAPEIEAKDEVKRKRPKLDVKVSAEDIPKSSSQEDSVFQVSTMVETKKEIKGKKSKPSVKTKKNNAVQSENGNSPGDATDLKNAKESKREPVNKEQSKFEGIDDAETPLLNLVLSDKTSQELDNKKDNEVVSDTKLLGGLVVNHAKKKKKVKGVHRGHSALQFLAPISEIGMGGPSAWDD